MKIFKATYVGTLIQSKRENNLKTVCKQKKNPKFTKKTKTKFWLGHDRFKIEGRKNQLK